MGAPRRVATVTVQTTFRCNCLTKSVYAATRLRTDICIEPQRLFMILAGLVSHLIGDVGTKVWLE